MIDSAPGKQRQKGANADFETNSRVGKFRYCLGESRRLGLQIWKMKCGRGGEQKDEGNRLIGFDDREARVGKQEVAVRTSLIVSVVVKCSQSGARRE